jgi:fumarylacetoacetase
VPDQSDFEVIDADRRSWVGGADGSGFPLQHLPYGVFTAAGRRPRIGVAIGESILDLAAAAEAGWLDDAVHDPELVATDRLNPLLEQGRATWAALRRSVAWLLDADNPAGAEAARGWLVPRAKAQLHRPFAVADYVDFYSSLEHATNLGRILRPDSEPLLPNWRHLPVGYHGRAGTVVPSGTPVARPLGQQRPAAEGEAPGFGPSGALDFELEVGFVTGPGPPLGQPVTTAEAPRLIFGLALVNDWSARDIQGWEYQPLGPFLGKSFATSIAPWVTPLDALVPFRVSQPTQEPPVHDYLRVDEDWGLELTLEAALRSSGMDEAVAVSQTTFADMYWTPPQQLAHATINGATIRAGDLYASGTVSGPVPGSYGSLMELTWRGAEPLALPDGTTRAFLQDGDTVVLRGWAGGDGPQVELGEVHGTITPAPAPG